MLAARTSDRDGQIETTVRLEAGYPAVEIGSDIVTHGDNIWACLEVVNDRLVQAGEGLEFCLPVGIGQAPDVEQEVDITGDSVLETKRLKEDRSLGRRRPGHTDPHQVAQFVDVGAGGIDVDIGELANRVQPLALQFDRLGQRAVMAGQGMAAAGLAVATDQGVGEGIEEHHLALDATRLGGEEQVGQVFEFLGVAAGVHPNGRIAEYLVDGIFQAQGQIFEQE